MYICRQIVQNVTSFRQLIISLGLKYPSGGAHSHLKKLVDKYSIDISHFTGQGWNKGNNSPYKHSIETFIDQVLCLNGKEWGSHRIKLKLLEFNLREHACEECNNDTWLRLPIPLELHHKNGKRNDNRNENIELLCPNCHALTTTNGGKNIRQRSPIRQRHTA